MRPEEYLIVVADSDEALFIQADGCFRHFDFVDYLNRDTVLARGPARVALGDFLGSPTKAEYRRQGSRDFVRVLASEIQLFATRFVDCSIVLVLPAWMMSQLRQALPLSLAPRICREIEKDMTHCSIATIQDRLAEELWEMRMSSFGQAHRQVRGSGLVH